MQIAELLSTFTCILLLTQTHTILRNFNYNYLSWMLNFISHFHWSLNIFFNFLKKINDNNKYAMCVCVYITRTHRYTFFIAFILHALQTFKFFIITNILEGKCVILISFQGPCNILRVSKCTHSPTTTSHQAEKELRRVQLRSVHEVAFCT